MNFRRVDLIQIATVNTREAMATPPAEELDYPPLVVVTAVAAGPITPCSNR